ncbi:enoyl-CoA hydratase/isomerase family protein, partial [Thermodesulfobacteriota bacterium]
MENDLVLYERKDKVAVITLNRAHKRNALSSGIVKGLRKTWIDFESDPSLRVAILTGNGKAFCAGMDFEDQNASTVSCIPNYGVEVTKPIIGAINGWAIGVGLTLALACDIKVVAENTSFIFPEAKIGSALGGVDMLKYMPYAIAMELWLTGEPLSAKRAYEQGLVNRVVPASELMSEALKFADMIKDNAPLTMKMLKMSAITHTLTAKSAWLLMEAQYITPQLESKDREEG